MSNEKLSLNSEMWKGRVSIAPTFAIELLTSKKPSELKRNMTKMQNV